MVKRKIDKKKRSLNEVNLGDNRVVVHFPTQLDRNNSFGCNLTLEARYQDVCKNICAFLNENEMHQLVQQSQFGHLIRCWEEYNNSNQLLWYLMSRQTRVSGSDEFWMVVHNRPVRFSLAEYCLITGLNCSSVYPTIPEADGFRSRHFSGREKVYFHDLEDKVFEMQIEGGVKVDIEKIKIACLYFVSGVLGPRRVKKDIIVDPEWIRLVDDLESFHQYPWGRLAYSEAHRGLQRNLPQKFQALMHREMQGRCQRGGSYDISGFIHPLQILAYECFPGVRDRYVTRKEGPDVPMPRMCRWVTNRWTKSPSMDDIVDAFNNCNLEDVIGMLIPTEEEQSSRYFMCGDFVDSTPDVVTVRIVELLSQGVAVTCSQDPISERDYSRLPTPVRRTHPTSPHNIRQLSPVRWTRPLSRQHIRQPSRKRRTRVPSPQHTRQSSPDRRTHPQSPPSYIPQSPDWFESRITRLEESLISLRREVMDEMRCFKADMQKDMSEMKSLLELTLSWRSRPPLRIFSRRRPVDHGAVHETGTSGTPVQKLQSSRGQEDLSAVHEMGTSGTPVQELQSSPGQEDPGAVPETGTSGTPVQELQLSCGQEDPGAVHETGTSGTPVLELQSSGGQEDPGAGMVSIGRGGTISTGAWLGSKLVSLLDDYLSEYDAEPIF